METPWILGGGSQERDYSVTILGKEEERERDGDYRQRPEINEDNLEDVTALWRMGIGMVTRIQILDIMETDQGLKIGVRG